MIKKETRKSFKIVITGGFSNLFKNSIKSKTIFNKDITIQGLIKKTLDGDDLRKFIDTITNAKKLTERKRYYVSNYGIENYIDIVNGKTDKIIKAPNYERYYDNELIEWWRKLATKRFDKLQNENRLRNDLEVWTTDSNIDIIR